MGCLVGGFLAKSGQNVFFLDKDSGRARNIGRQGIRVEGVSGEFCVKGIKIATEAKSIGRSELIIITTKSYDTEEAIKLSRPLIDGRSRIMTLQNGLGNIETINRYIPRAQIIAGVTAEGATLLAPGRIRHAGRGETIIGAVSGYRNPEAVDKLKEIADIFNRAGFGTKITHDIIGLIWLKLIVNVGINSLTAITRLNNGRLVEFEGTREIMQAVVKEAVAVARKKKIKLTYSHPLEKVESVCRATAANVSSMLQDISRKKRTEIDFINGAIVREGKKLGIPTPVNSALTGLVKTIESSYTLQIVR